MRLNHNKIVSFFILLFLFSGCKSLKIKNSDEFIIFQQIINDRSLNNMYLIENAEREGFKKLLIEESGDNMFDMWEWDSLQNFISHKDAKTIFNDNEIEFYKLQLNREVKWNKNYYPEIVNKNDIIKLKEGTTYATKNFLLLSISSIVFTSDNSFALAYYGYSDRIGEHGKSGLLIYKNDEGKWKYFTELFL